MPRRRRLPKFVYEDDARGKTRLRFRRGDLNYDFKHPYGSEGFEQEIAICRRGQRPDDHPTIEETVSEAGTMNALAEYYYNSHDFLGLQKMTKVDYRCVIDKFLETYGNTAVEDYDYAAVSDIITNRAATPSQANKLLKRLKTLFKLARRLKWITTYPAEGVKRVKTPSAGHISWQEEDIKKYEGTHPRGSLARRALYLFLYTGARKGDCIQFGRQNIKNGTFDFRARKNKKNVSLTILPKLKEELDLVPADQMLFILTEHGAPFTVNGFGNKMRKWCDEAGLKLSAHGLRKAAGRRLAEAGATEDEIAAVLAISKRTAAIYTAAANTTLLAAAGIEKITQ